ncbi:hypothetical protein M0R45_030880 [Rubus argutus]|uniref:Uncharacterized protein n=1 Tax=Rubus argutus TaxID=59490 RepID=A0AAW1WBZ4_RUBAR
MLDSDAQSGIAVNAWRRFERLSVLLQIQCGCRRWAEAFFEGEFFWWNDKHNNGGEAMNKDIKAGINNQSKIFEILPIIKNTHIPDQEHVIKDDYNSRFLKPVPTLTCGIWNAKLQTPSL